jgi:hypothetical protein
MNGNDNQGTTLVPELTALALRPGPPLTRATYP